MKKSIKLVIIDEHGNPAKTATVSGEGDDIDERLGRVMAKIKQAQIEKGWTEADLQSFKRKMRQ
jgi:hypothetical protein